MSEQKSPAAMLSAFLSKKKDGDGSSADKKASLKLADTRNWYVDRYNSVLIQRNFMVIVTVVCIAAVIISVMVVAQITSQKTIEPFVIQVEDRSGITKVIRPLTQEYLSRDTAVNNYFIVRYIQSRESYFHPTHEYDYRTAVRLMSAEGVYMRFRRQISTANEDSPVRWGERGERRIEILTILPSELASGLQGQGAQVRFRVTDIREGRAPVSRVKVARLRFDYVDMELTDEERYVNPVGFQVLQYQSAYEFTSEE